MWILWRSITQNIKTLNNIRFTNSLLPTKEKSEITNESSINNAEKYDFGNSEKEVFNDSKTIDFSWNSIHMKSLRDLKSLSDRDEKLLIPKIANKSTKL